MVSTSINHLSMFRQCFSKNILTALAYNVNRRSIHVTWIKTIAPKDDPELQIALQNQGKLYPQEYKVPVDAVKYAGEALETGIAMSHSLIPQALYHAFSLYGTLLSPDLPLSRRQHEMIASTVSSINSCFY